MYANTNMRSKGVFCDNVIWLNTCYRDSEIAKCRAKWSFNTAEISGWGVESSGFGKRERLVRMTQKILTSSALKIYMLTTSEWSTVYCRAWTALKLDRCCWVVWKIFESYLKTFTGNHPYDPKLSFRYIVNLPLNKVEKVFWRGFHRSIVSINESEVLCSLVPFRGPWVACNSKKRLKSQNQNRHESFELKE